MGKIEKIQMPNGDFMDAERIEVSQASEHWNQYLLEDGAVLKLKSITTKVVRLKDQYDQTGNPIYIIQSNNVVDVDCPEGLKKK